MASLDLQAVPAVAYPNMREKDPRKKTHKWIKTVAQAYLSEVFRSKNGMWYDGRASYAKLLKYALGKQDTQQYLRYQAGSAGATDPMALAGIVDQAPLPVLPIKLRALESMLNEREYDPTINVLGAQAEQDVQKLVSELQIWMEQGQALRQMGMQPPSHLPDDIPQDADDLRDYLENLQLDAEIAMEEKLAVCLEESNAKLLGQIIRRELIRYGLCCLHDSQLPGQRPLVKHIAPARGLFLPSAKPDCSDWWAGAHTETTTLAAVRREVAAGVAAGCRDLDELEWKALENSAGNTMAGFSDSLDPELARKAESGRLEVVRVFFLSDDELVQHTKRTAAGNPKTYKKDFGFKNAKGEGTVHRTTLSNVYEATLVVGTDVAYNCRLAVEQKRDPQNPLQGRLPYAAYVASQVEGQAVSVVDYCISIINDMERSIRMWRADMATYVPEGYIFSPKALASIPLKGPDGKDLSAQAAIEYFFRTGNGFGETYDLDNGVSLAPPIQKGPGGVPATAQQHWADFWNSMQLLEVVTGANAVVSAATPSSEQGKAVSAMALQGTQNVLRYLFDAQESVHLAIAKNLTARIWATEHRNPVTGSLRLAGGQGKQVKPFPGLHKYTFLTGIEPRPTPEEWQELYDVAKTAWQAGLSGNPDGLDYEDYLFVRRVPNLKRAARELARRIKRRRKRLQQESEQLQQQNAQVQQQSTMATSQAQMQVDAAKHAQNMELETLRGQNQASVVQMQVEGASYVAELTNQTKAALAESQQEGTLARDLVQQQHENFQTDQQAAHRLNEIERAAEVAPKPAKKAA